MKRNALALLFAALLAFPSTAAAAPASQAPYAPGAVVSLRGTPHIWIADDRGVLHWGGDTRALAGKFVNWDNRTEATLEQIQAARPGDPWLSAGLLKDGDPIYLPKWETTADRPTLFRIQSISDVQVFGI